MALDRDHTFPDTGSIYKRPRSQLNQDPASSLDQPQVLSSLSSPSFTENTMVSITKNIIKEFHPAWFVSVMGTGITAAVLYHFPYEAEWLRICGIIMFGINSFLLVFTTVLFILGLGFYDMMRTYLYDVKFSVFLGCLEMGFTSWCNMLYFLIQGKCMILIYILWWIGNILTLFTSWFIFYNLIKHTKGITLDNFNNTLLLPVVPLTVVASSAGIFYNDLPDNLKLSTLLVAFLLWANSLIVAFMITTFYFGKILIHKVPPLELVFTSFIPIGFSGQGAYAIQLFGLNYHDYQLSLININNNSLESKIIAISIKHVSIFIALFLETFGFFLTFLSIISVFSYMRKLKFHKGWWAMTFPMGTMCLSTNETFKQTDWQTFRIISVIYGTCLIIITITCLIGSLIYEAPICWTRQAHDPDNQVSEGKEVV